MIDKKIFLNDLSRTNLLNPAKPSKMLKQQFFAWSLEKPWRDPNFWGIQR